MLELTDTQAKILKVFIDNYRDDSNKISIGLSANQIEKEYGLVSKTFRNNRNFFLKNYFLRLSATGYHGALRNYHFFQITRFGILAYLKWTSKQPVHDIELDKDFFPLLWKHWEKLIDIYQEVFFDIFQKSMTYLEIDYQYVFHVKGNDYSSNKLSEILTIPMGTVEIKLFTDYPVLKLQELPTERQWGETKHFQSLNQNIDDKITERFTFLLYYNLLNSGLTGHFDLLFNHISNKFLLKDNPTESDLDNSKLEIIKFVEKMKQNTDKLFLIIKKDKELCNLMKSTLSEITKSMNNRKSLKTMIEQLG